MNAPFRKQGPPLPVFFATTIVIFFLALSAADSIGFVPNYLDESSVEAAASGADTNTLPLSDLPELGQEITPHIDEPSPDTSTPRGKTVVPTHIRVDAINLDLAVQNPATRDIATLDALLTNGPARYVDSAKLGSPGNIILFAHSSHLPIVHNKMFQAFNRIPELKTGDTIALTGEDDTTYLYSVQGPAVKADAGNTTIDLSSTGSAKLTLVTCDTLTGKSARFVLTADFVGTIGQ